MKIISRQDALAQGLARYFTGKPCKHGHVAERHTNNRLCLACARAQQTAYYERHIEERRAWQRNYLKRKALQA